MMMRMPWGRILGLSTAIMISGLVIQVKIVKAGEISVSADSGWVSLFNGKNFDGLYIRSGATLQNPATQTAYRIEGDSIHVLKSSGLLTTKKIYAHYQMRVKYRYAASGADQNAGLQYHVEATDYDSLEKFGTQNKSVPYFFGRSFVQSIEFQTYVGNAGAFIGIGNLWARTTVSPGQVYAASGTAYITTPSDGGSRYINTSSPKLPAVYWKWVQCQINVYGADSTVHFIDGQIVVKAFKLRKVVQTDASGANFYVTDTSQTMPMNAGHIGLQAEGSDIYYRDWQLRQLDEKGEPIIPVSLHSMPKKIRAINRSKGNGSEVLVRPQGFRDFMGRKSVPASRKLVGP
jgi:hypothetical protein